jgi:hypothetical protein
MTATATTATAEDLEVDEDAFLDPGLKDVGTAKLISLKSAASPAEEQRVPAFKVNGTVYTIAARIRTNQGLKYLHLARTKGSEIAIDYALELLLGEEGYEALREFDDLTEEDLKAVCDAAVRIMNGPVEGPKGKQKNASRRSRG